MQLSHFARPLILHKLLHSGYTPLKPVAFKCLKALYILFSVKKNTDIGSHKICSEMYIKVFSIFWTVFSVFFSDALSFQKYLILLIRLKL